MANHFVLDDVQLLEQRLVDLPPELRTRLRVHRVRVVDECERSLNSGRSGGEGVVAGREGFLNAASLGRDLGEAPPEPILRSIVFGGKVVQVLLLEVELRDARREMVAEQLGGLGLVGERLSQMAPHACLEAALELHCCVVPLDGCLNDIDGYEATRARPARLLGAEEVEVLAAVADCVVQHQPALLPGRPARPAPDGSFQVVGVLSMALTRCCARLEDLLDLLEQCLGDQRLVTALVHLAVVDDDPAVVRVAQHPLDLRLRHGPSRITPAPPTQPAFLELIGDAFDRVLAGGEELEAELDERRSFRVDGDSVDLATVVLLA